MSHGFWVPVGLKGCWLRRYCFAISWSSWINTPAESSVLVCKSEMLAALPFAACSTMRSQAWAPQKYLSSDDDLLFLFHQWKANLRVLEVAEIKTVPHVPISHPFVERLIGTVRREYLDEVLFWNAADLKSKLTEFQHYYNEERVHTALDGKMPSEAAGRSLQPRVDIGEFQWKSHCRGLFKLPVAA